MHPDMPSENETDELIRMKAGYGLALPAWLRTLEAIRRLPEIRR